MFEPVPVPLWLLLLILAFAAVAFLSHFLFPSVRWFFRRRMERAVTRLNARLDRPIDPFKLMERQDMIARLSYDPKVMEAVVEQARVAGVPESVTFQKARAYAGEIVPSFSATVYFGFATRAARWLSGWFYRVQLGPVDAAISQIDRQATVIYVMNHRSNMDYVLVTWLVADRSAISYAVGEWAQVWPLSALIRASGAYFIRRKSLTPLYRRVLARYVQITTAEGSTQAIFPEGGLSLDGRTGPAKLGLLGYIVSGFDAGGPRDVVFVPVGLGYDRVLEDRMLVEAHRTGVRRFRARPFAILGFVARTIWRKLRGRFPGFGSAAVAFGAPISLRALIGETPYATPEAQTELLGERLMDAVRHSVPVLPVPLVAAAFAEGPATPEVLLPRIEELTERLVAVGAVLLLPEGGAAAALATGLRILRLRDMVIEEDGAFSPAPEKAGLVSFYAASVLQRLGNEKSSET
ncbi:MAG: glycerol-3-phosphate acyltransferase [Cereibacter sphaeroides]|uniref:Glycerol-3-phosphate acyltransferase n=1 Tax=Cereibacter sphaeroides TaxID=1063 RepID=A0A2W5SN24_CERSP|nr:MAG: glycerol-3-phosphate acyltransferase [Cereibacter sphaeroides]